MVVVSPSSAPCTVTPTIAPVSRSIACSALCTRCVRPSFIFVILASGSCGCVQSSFEPFFFRPDAEKIAQRQQVRRAPGDAAFGVNALEIPDQQQPEIDPRRQF